MTNKALIYDDNCPLCDAYTKVFVRTNLLEARIAFSEVHPQDLNRIDAVRSKHEIPLLDLDGGETLYGLDSLIEVLSTKFPLLRKIMRIGFIYYFFHWLYQLVSYNRRLIVGKNGCDNGFDCTPDFNFKFRSLYILLSTFITVCIFLIFGLMSTPIFSFGVFGVIGIAFFWSYLRLPNLRTRFAYLGQFCTVFLIGALLLTPSIILYLLLPNVPFFFFTLNFISSVVLMIVEGKRRRKYRALR